MAKLAGEGNGGGNGIFVQEGEIVDVQLGEKSTTYEQNYNFILIVKIQPEDKDAFEKKIFIGGKLWKDGSIPKNHSNLLYAAGIKELDDDQIAIIVDNFALGILSDEVKNLLVGTKIKYLSYVSGTYESENGEKPSYKTWNGNGEGFNYPNTWDIKTENSDIIEAFEKKLKGNYPPEYTPEVLEELENKKDGAENSGSGTAGSEGDDLMI